MTKLRTVLLVAMLAAKRASDPPPLADHLHDNGIWSLRRRGGPIASPIGKNPNAAGSVMALRGGQVLPGKIISGLDRIGPSARRKRQNRIRNPRLRAAQNRTCNPRRVRATMNSSNPEFEEFYRAQQIVPPEEWDSFMAALRRPLPVTFRIDGAPEFVHEFLPVFKDKFLSALKAGDTPKDGCNQTQSQTPDDALLRVLDWFPGGCAMEVVGRAKQELRTAARDDVLELREALIALGDAGVLSRQEAARSPPNTTG